MINLYIKNSRMCLLYFNFSCVITQPATLLKKRIACNFFKKEHFPVNFPKFLRTFFLAEHLRQLLLLALVKPCSKVRPDLHLREFFSIVANVPKNIKTVLNITLPDNLLIRKGKNKN